LKNPCSSLVPGKTTQNISSNVGLNKKKTSSQSWGPYIDHDSLVQKIPSGLTSL
jgi:hypothetical protein